VGWIRALEKVRIRIEPSRSGSVVGMLEPGDAARVEELSVELGGAERGWLRLVEPATGWIQPRIDGRSVIRRYPPAEDARAGSIDVLVAGANELVGVGWTVKDGGYVPRLIQSADGVLWRAAATPDLRSGDVHIADGPAGWLLMSTLDDGAGPLAVPWVWQSADLAEWQLLGAIPDLPGGIAQLAGNGAGYVAIAGNGISIWFSTDGLVWTERPNLLLLDSGFVRLAATPLGFYLDAGSRERGAVASGTKAAFSPDGWTWSEVGTNGMETVLGMAAFGDELMAVGSSFQGDHRAWIGTIRGAALTWHQEPAASTAFEGAVVSAITSDGQRPVVLGWDRRTNVPLWWVRDGAGWQVRQLPPGFEGRPRLAAGSSAGTVVVGYRPTLTAANPVLWHLAAGDRWASEVEPVFEVEPEPTPEECGDAPSDILEVVTRDPLWLAQCFGSRPLTFRAWSSSCDGCYAEDDPGTSESAWLQQPTNNLMLLSPTAHDSWEPYWETLEGVLIPPLTIDRSWREQWVEITGHYDDPAAASCDAQPDASEELWHDPVEVVNQCRARFVITSVRAVPGP
jgi:hypothetical protein